jgi:tartrate dehydratase alpha subunit/fumarate hydratase class I-like protein
MKSTRNTGKPITKAVIQEVKSLAKQNTPTRVIGLKIGRTENSVRTIASKNDISLKPTNQSPYNRKK